jgi:hypothetical protein
MHEEQFAPLLVHNRLAGRPMPNGEPVNVHNFSHQSILLVATRKVSHKGTKKRRRHKEKKIWALALCLGLVLCAFV